MGLETSFLALKAAQGIGDSRLMVGIGCGGLPVLLSIKSIGGVTWLVPV